MRRSIVVVVVEGQDLLLLGTAWRAYGHRVAGPTSEQRTGQWRHEGDQPGGRARLVDADDLHLADVAVSIPQPDAGTEADLIAIGRRRRGHGGRDSSLQLGTTGARFDRGGAARSACSPRGVT